MSDSRTHKLEEKSDLVEEQRSNRRDLFSLSIAGLAGGILNSCGEKANFTGENALEDKRSSKVGGEEGNGVSPDGDGDGDGDGDEVDSKEESPVSEVDPSEDNSTDDALSKNNEESAEEETTEEALALQGEKDVTKATDIAFGSLRERLYGTVNAAMLAIANINDGFQIGDELQLVIPVNESTGTILATKTIVDTQDASKAQVFDNLYLSKIEELWLILTRSGNLFRYKISDLSNKMNKEPELNSDNIAHPQGMITSGNFKATYYDVMPTFSSSAASTSVGAFKGSLNRDYFFAAKDANWSGATFTCAYAQIPTTTSSVTEIIAFDPVGRLLKQATGDTVTLDPSQLLNHNMIVVYVKDGDQYNRYFYFIG